MQLRPGACNHLPPFSSITPTRCPRKMLIYSTTNKFICLSYDLSNLFNNEHFYGASFILLLLWTTSIQGRNSIYPRIILASSSHAPGLSCITLCRPMRWLESLCKLCTVQLRPRPYLYVHEWITMNLPNGPFETVLLSSFRNLSPFTRW